MSVFASRYARAFADVVLSRSLDPQKVIQQLSSLTETLRVSSELRSVWESPSVPGQQKIKVLDALARQGGLFQETRNFVAVLIDHNRIKSFVEIALQFQQEIDQRLGFVKVEINSARALETGEKSSLERQIAIVSGKQVRASYSQDPSLLGGAVVKIGSAIYDGSVRGRLEKLRQELTAG